MNFIAKLTIGRWRNALWKGLNLVWITIFHHHHRESRKIQWFLFPWDHRCVKNFCNQYKELSVRFGALVLVGKKVSRHLTFCTNGLFCLMGYKNNKGNKSKTLSVNFTEKEWCFNSTEIIEIILLTVSFRFLFELRNRGSIIFHAFAA